MIQVKQFRGRDLVENINLFLSANPYYKLIDIKYSQAVYGNYGDVESISHALVIYEVDDNESN